jgi:hypothetical protein
VFPHWTRGVEVLLKFTMIGEQPLDRFEINEGAGGDCTQTFLVMVSLPQLFLTIKETLYCPGDVNLTPNELVPHVPGLSVGDLNPVSPLAIVHPDPGVIIQFLLVVVSQTPKLSTATPTLELLVKFTTEFTQAILSGLIIIPALGFIEVVIG